MSDLAAMAQKAEIEEILREFGLDIKVTHVNIMHWDDRRKHFAGIYQGNRLGFYWIADRNNLYDWHKEGLGSIRHEGLGLYGHYPVEKSWGNMVYVGRGEKDAD